MVANNYMTGRPSDDVPQQPNRLWPPRSRGSNRPSRLARILLAAGVAVVAFAVAVNPSSAQVSSNNLFASVSSGGGLLAGHGVIGVTHFGTGRYEVTFSANVSGCAYVATINGAPQVLQVFTAGGHSSPDGVYVETKNYGGGLTDGPFNLVVDCGGPGWSYAVVGYTANLERSSPGTTLTSLGFGRYDVTFTRNVANCAYLATVGDPGNTLVFNPAGVYTGSARNPDAVYIETKNQSAGLTAGVPFHLAVICPAAAGTEIAVVGADGLIARGSSLTSSFSTAAGGYVVVTNKSVTACATVATRGSIDQSLPIGPTTVSIVPGPAANTVGIQLRNLFGHVPESQDFHVAIVCGQLPANNIDR